MALEAFPSYPKLQRRGYQPKPPATTHRSPMDSGLAQQREVQTKRYEQWVCPYLIETKANFEAWRTWFYDTINQSDWFSWVDPLSGNTKTARIVANSYDGGRPLNNALSVWRITFTIEFAP